jgi:predicted acetyltransferase
LIDRSLEMMRDRGQYLSLLWPFDHRFYRRYGWDWVGHERHYTVPLSLIETSPEGEYVEPVFDGAFEVLNPVYEAKARQYNGPFVRSEKRWEYLLKQRGKKQAACYVYRRDGSAEGLGVIRYDEKKNAARANEFVALTPRAYLGLMTLFKRHAATVKKFIWSVPMDDMLFSLLAHWDVKTQIFPSAMGRVVDVRAALEALSPSSELSGRTLVSISDSRANWNNGVWSVSAEGGRVEAARSAGSVAVSLDVAALSQAYWGTPSLLDLRRARRLEVSDEAAFDFLARLLPPSPVWLADDF